MQLAALVPSNGHIEGDTNSTLLLAHLAIQSSMCSVLAPHSFFKDAAIYMQDTGVNSDPKRAS